MTGGSEVKEEKATNKLVENDEMVLEKNSSKTSTADLPPHVVLDMPALSPTMVRKNRNWSLPRLLC